jgi:hypothetical protein
MGSGHVVEVDCTRWDGDIAKLSDKTVAQLVDKLWQKQAADRELLLPASETAGRVKS